MRYCGNCKVNVLDHTHICPLCQSPLLKETSPFSPTFPMIPTLYQEHHIFFRILMMVSVIVGLSSVVVNFFLSQHGMWSLIVIAAIICIWVSLITALRTRHNITRDLFYESLLLSVFVILWDLATGWRGWSLGFVIPITFSAFIIASHILSLVLKMKNEDYLFYMVITAFFGIIPIILFCCGLLITPYPSLLCVLISIVSFTILLFFKGKAIKGELERRLHL